MNVMVFFDYRPRFLTWAQYYLKELSKRPDINILYHGYDHVQIGITSDEKLMEKTDLILNIDDGTTWFKFHHHTDIIKKHNVKTAYLISDTHENHPEWIEWRRQQWKQFPYDHLFFAQKDAMKYAIEDGYDKNQVHWNPHAVDIDFWKPMTDIEKKYDIGFIGYMHSERKRRMDMLTEYMNTKYFPDCFGWLANRRMNELKMIMNDTLSSDYLNMRTFETMACSLPLLNKCDKDNDNGFLELFRDGRDCFIYNSDEELKEIAVRLLANRELCMWTGINGYEIVVSNHTYKYRIDNILKIIGGN